MPQTETLELVLLSAQQQNPELTWNYNLQVLSALTHPEIQDRTLVAEPAVGASDYEKLWITTGSPTGSAWADNGNKAAVWYNDGASGAWFFCVPPVDIYYNSNTSIWEYYDGSSWGTADI